MAQAREPARKELCCCGYCGVVKCDFCTGLRDPLIEDRDEFLDEIIWMATEGMDAAESAGGSV